MILLSCNSTYRSSIPDFPVYLELDLTYEDRGLKSPQASKIYIKGKSALSAYEKTGFGGVLVYNGIRDGSSENYYAFDAACPVEVNQKIIVEVDSFGIYAVCPECGTKYDISYGIGNPIEGIAKERLKRYPVDRQGDILYIAY